MTATQDQMDRLMKAFNDFAAEMVRIETAELVDEVRALEGACEGLAAELQEERRRGTKALAENLRLLMDNDDLRARLAMHERESA